MMNFYLRKAREEIRAHFRIFTDTAARLMALGVDVGALEYKLLHEIHGDD